MKQCILDGTRITGKEMLHDIMADALDFPTWYGRNLDALYDCLTDLSEETEILLRQKDALTAHLGDYAESLVQVLRTASEHNPRLRWETEC